MTINSNLSKSLCSFSLVLLINFLFCFPATTQTQENKILLRDGTEVKVKLNRRLSSKTSKNGEPLSAEIAENIIVDGKVLVKAGTKVNGIITGVEKAKRLGQEGTLSIVVSSTRTIDDQKLDLRASQDSKGKDTVASTVALSLLISPLFLLRRGKDLTIPAGKVFPAFVNEDLYVESNLAAPEEDLKRIAEEKAAEEEKTKQKQKSKKVKFIRKSN